MVIILPRRNCLYIYRISLNVEAENKEIVRQLLMHYHASFVKSDRDLGRTDIIKHNINTGDSLPIKQAPRRIPVHMQKEVDGHIDD